MALNWIEGVLQRSKHTGTDLLLMLLMAEAADRDTGSCYPGRKTLARLMRCSERTVQRTIQTLVDSGEVSVKVQGSHFGTNLYTLSRSLLGGDNADSPYAQTTPGGDNSDSLGGDKNVSPGETKMSPKPSGEPSERTKEKDKTSSYPKSARGSRLPDDYELDDKHRQKAHAMGLRNGQVEREWEKFTHYWWAASGPRAVKVNWYSAWVTWLGNVNDFAPRATNGRHSGGMKQAVNFSEMVRQRDENVIDVEGSMR